MLLIRESERLSSRPEVTEMPGIPTNALWFITGKTAPESGQIAPALYDPKNYETDEEKQA
ncbi:MAG: hypothetical protein MEPRV_01536 [Providencia sp.]